jgi:hypothetical protein
MTALIEIGSYIGPVFKSGEQKCREASNSFKAGTEVGFRWRFGS